MTKKKAGAKKPQTENKTQKGTAQASTDAGAVNEAAKAKAAEEAKAKEAEAAKAKAAEEAKAKEAEAAKAKAAEESKAKAGKKGKETRPTFKDDRGLQFRFKNNAPKTLNIDGKSTKISEIIQSPEIMLELIYGNSNFIEQIH